jgi:hypothetical protein
MPNGTFQSGASDDPTASHDERCTLASHSIAVARGCRCNRNRHRYRLSRRPPAPTRRMALAAQARRWYVSDAFRGARIRKDLGRPRQRSHAAATRSPAKSSNQPPSFTPQRNTLPRKSFNLASPASTEIPRAWSSCVEPALRVPCPRLTPLSAISRTRSRKPRRTW